MSSQETFSTKASLQLPVGSIIPHLLLPCANILALASPPFKGRGLLWSSLTASLAYLSLFDSYPSNTPIRYGLSCIWVFYLWTLGVLLFTQPEQTYWRLDRPRAEAASMPFGLQKLQWAAALWINPRGIGWNYQMKGVRLAKDPNSKLWFVLQQISWFLVYYVVVVFTIIYLSRHPYSRDMDSMTWMRCVITELDMAIMVAFSWQMQWTMVSIVGVASGLSQPRVCLSLPPWWSDGICITC
jgi:hypothetical protein